MTMRWALLLVLKTAVLCATVPLEDRIQYETDDKNGIKKPNSGEYGGLFEGDILLPPKQKRNGDPDISKRWPNGIVPYKIDYSVDSSHIPILYEAFKYYAKTTCVQLVPRTNEDDYVIFKSSSGGCFSYVGRIGRGQFINLAASCFTSFGTVLHEIMHALGFGHEMSREDRDQYINIHWENIPDSIKYAFEKQKGWLTYGTKYDIKSVMQYSSKAFTMNGDYTITPKSWIGTPSDLGQRNELSDTDIYKIRAMYGLYGDCNNPATVMPTTPTTTSPGTDTSSQSCTDNHDLCPSWAGRDPSECDANPGYMLYNCRKSCNTCGRRLGCYSGVTGKMYFATSTPLNSPNYCMRFCGGRGYPYAGLRDGDRCYCGENNLIGKGAATPCDTQCPGTYNAVTCGNNYNYEIYHIE